MLLGALCACPSQMREMHLSPKLGRTTGLLLATTAKLGLGVHMRLMMVANCDGSTACHPRQTPSGLLTLHLTAMRTIGTSLHVAPHHQWHDVQSLAVLLME